MRTLSDIPDQDEALILRLQYDIATGVHTPDTIAKRYGMKDEAELRVFLRDHPQICKNIERMIAVFESDAATDERVRFKFLNATEDLILPMAHIAGNLDIPPQIRIDAFKQIQRGAGVDGVGAGKERGGIGSGQQFVLNIMFRGGKPENIIGETVTNADEIPSMPSLTYKSIPGQAQHGQSQPLGSETGEQSYNDDEAEYAVEDDQY